MRSLKRLDPAPPAPDHADEQTDKAVPTSRNPDLVDSCCASGLAAAVRADSRSQHQMKTRLWDRSHGTDYPPCLLATTWRRRSISLCRLRQPPQRVFRSQHSLARSSLVLVGGSADLHIDDRRRSHFLDTSVYKGHARTRKALT
ncbi:hypothetical protein RTBOTA2_004769 [Rhodotorula toruloides]|nr:hypothetical protein RTBOTA2_004769 [Rhodotorula toruloides]